MNWVSTPEKEISFEHCDRPAYWEGEDVYCSKCQIKLEDSDTPLCGDHIVPIGECGCKI